MTQNKLTVGLLVCDHVDDAHVGISGDYPDMYRTLLQDRVDLVDYAIIDGQRPPEPDECEGWIITGSRAAVYDDYPWIANLTEFVRAAAAEASPTVGICFGHQMLAHALGGRVSPASKGWGVGVHEVEVIKSMRWMVPGSPRFSMLNSHSDQIVVPPEKATILGSSEHCEISLMTVGMKMLGIQGHPEFSHGYAAALLDARRGHVIPEPVAELAIRSLQRDADSALIADWIVKFLEWAQSKEQAPKTNTEKHN